MLSRQGHTYNGADLVRVVDEQMNDVPRDGETVGEVVMRGNSVMVGYHNKPEETEEAFKGGWFHSGDLAVWHPTATSSCATARRTSSSPAARTSRASRSSRRSPSTRPSTRSRSSRCPDEKWGERPKAFVELKDGKDVSEEDDHRVLQASTSRASRSRAAVEFGELPRTSTGKVQKFVLREKEWEGREKAIG